MAAPALHWTDILELALALSEAHPQVDPRAIRFTDLHRWVCALEGFADPPNKANEKILEAIQMAWIEQT